MTDTHFKIVFEGQLLEGVARETARLNLAQLFKSDVSAIDRLFSGQPITLKRGLIRSEAERYLEALHSAGVQARIDVDAELSLNLDMAQEPAATAPDASPYAPPRAQLDKHPLHGNLKVFSIQGRIGRLRYLAWSLVLLSAGVLAGLLSAAVLSVSLVGGGLLVTVIALAFAVVSVQIGTQRLHDIGWSGWCLCINLVPFVGSFFPFVMVLMPGNAGANAYGPPAPANSRSVKVLASLWVVMIALFIALSAFTGVASLTRGLQSTVDSYEQTLPYDDDDDNSDNARPSSGKFFQGGQSL